MVNKSSNGLPSATRGLIPLPEGDVPEDTQCVSICIPNDPAYKRQLYAGLYVFTHWTSYERDDTHKATLVAQAWRKAIMEGMLNCYQFRTNGGVQQYSTDGGETWSNAPSVNDGETGVDPRDDEPLKPARTGDNKPCLAAANATACFVELHREVVQWYNDVASGVVLLGAISLILGVFFPVLWAVTGLAISGTALAITFLTYSAYLNMAAFTTTIQDELTCILYCRADSSGQWGQAAFDRVLTAIGDKSGGMWELILVYVRDVAGIKGLNNAGTTTSVPSHDCAACDCGWCYTFEPSWLDVDIVTGTLGVGVIEAAQWFDGGQGYYNFVVVEIPVTANVTEILATYDASTDLADNTPENFIYVDTMAVENRLVRVNPSPSGTGLTMHYEGSVTPSVKIGVVV